MSIRAPLILIRAGDGAGGVILPLVMQALLSRFGLQITLRAIACAMVVLMAPLLVFVKPRLPIPASSAARPIDTTFLRSPLFWVFQTCSYSPEYDLLSVRDIR